MNPLYPFVAARALHTCEYCRAPEAVFNLAFEVEHITPLSLGGDDRDDNLALACRSCNLHKAAFISARDPETDQVVPLFHPRSNRWEEHFQLDRLTGQIEGTSAVGRATVAQLNMNGDVQTLARRHWLRLGLLP